MKELRFIIKIKLQTRYIFKKSQLIVVDILGKGKLMKVLILSGKFGSGHVSVAKAVTQQVEDICPKAEVRTVDFLEYAGAGDIIYKAFDFIIRKGNYLFNFAYKRSSEGGGSLPAMGFCMKEYERLLEEMQPDIVVSVLPITTKIAGEYKVKYNCGVRTAACITDMSIHETWVSQGIDDYLVGSQGTKGELCSCGIDPEKVHITGIPVRKEFSPTAEERQGTARRLLISGGGMGLIRKDEEFFSMLNNAPNLKTTVVCASNEKLFNWLDGRYENITAHGFVENFEEYLSQADLVLTKSGGITLSEAIACRTPIVAVKPFLEQEVQNAEFIKSYGVGAVLEDDSPHSANRVRHMIWDDDFLSRCRENMSNYTSSLEHSTMKNLIHPLFFAA